MYAGALAFFLSFGLSAVAVRRWPPIKYFPIKIELIYAYESDDNAHRAIDASMLDFIMASLLIIYHLWLLLVVFDYFIFRLQETT